MPKNNFNGCEWCGRRIPSLPNQGLEQAHIFADEHGPQHGWNVFSLCPTCHIIFDEVIKPKLRKAFANAVGGFNDPPSHKASPKIKVGKTYKDAVDRLIKPNKGQVLAPLPEENTCDGLKTWKDDFSERKKRYAGKSPN